jgi:hypothetical protein
MRYMFNVIMRGDRATNVAMEKAINFTYSECVFVVLGIQSAMRMACAVYSSVS